MKKSPKSPALASVHETVSDLYEAGIVPLTDMKKFDELCLTAVTPLSPEEIRAIRRTANVSQSVFARHLNVSVGIVSQWKGAKSARLEPL